MLSTRQASRPTRLGALERRPALAASKPFSKLTLDLTSKWWFVGVLANLWGAGKAVYFLLWLLVGLPIIVPNLLAALKTFLAVAQQSWAALLAVVWGCIHVFLDDAF